MQDVPCNRLLKLFYDKSSNIKDKIIYHKKNRVENRVVLDGVFSHTGADSKYFNKFDRYEGVGAYKSYVEGIESQYRSWYSFIETDDGVPAYESWWGFPDLPNVNENDLSYRRFVFGKGGVVDTWINRGASGLRLDVSDELPDSFIRQMREAVMKYSNNDGVVIGEVWEDASNKCSYGSYRDFMLGRTHDSVMGYTFRDGLLSFLARKMNAEDFDAYMEGYRERYPSEAYYSMMNLISSHDVPRAVTVLAGKDDPGTRELQKDIFLDDEELEDFALEFMDKVLEIPAKDIQAPGPVLEYEFEGETHRWITDIYYIPANLLIEIKDGGSNPNTRSMPSYRAKQVAKETMITNLGTFNYVRLTNNDFSQLLDILADMKTEVLEEENPKMKIHINEEVGGLPKHGPPAAYIVPYGMNNAFTGSSGLAYSDTEMDSVLIQDPISNEIIPVSKEVFKETAQINGTYFYYNKNDNILTKIESVHKKLNEYKSLNELIEEFAGCKINRPRDILLSESFSAIDRSIEKKICSFIENAITTDLNSSGNAYVVETKGNVMIKKDLNGFYANITGNFNMSSDYYSDIEELKSSGVIELMQNLYNSNVGSDKDDE